MNQLVQNQSLWALLCQVQFSADQPAKLKAFRAILEPLRHTLQHVKFLGGDKLNYADIAVAGNFLVCTIQACVMPTLSTTAGHQHNSSDFFDGCIILKGMQQSCGMRCCIPL